MDCGNQTAMTHKDEYYMIHDALWLKANPKGEGMLCIGCVEDRLGRRLSADDFTDCLLNKSRHGKSERLISRLQTQGRKRAMSKKQITGMYELLDAIKAVIEASDPTLQKTLAETFDAYADDFPDEYLWATGAQAPVLLHHLMISCQPTTLATAKSSKSSKIGKVMQAN
jgi:hypothetical protein